ncbi:MAG: phage minor head protein [Candidatus Methylumidiphilus sp.]
MVAGATKAELLTDFYNAVEKAHTEGKSLKWFQKQFKDIVATHGWDYTGARDWRSRVIYSTNLSTSYAAGRWAQLHHPDLLKNRPYWRYVHSDLSRHPRLQHLAWNGLVLRHDDGFWDAHFPPNGFGCRCRITAVREPEGGPDTAPDDGTYEKLDKKTGEVHTLPVGVDYGFGYAPGKSVWKPDPASYPAKIGQALGKDLGMVDRRDAITRAHFNGDIDVHDPDKIMEKTGIDAAGVARLTGAMDGSLVSVSPDDAGMGIHFDIVHPFLNESMKRTVYTKVMEIENENFILKKAHQGKGLGARSFALQVDSAARDGYVKITTYAVGSHGNDLGLNGYYTWARLGYDAPLTAAEMQALPTGLAGSISVADLMASEEGAAWWKLHGNSRTMVFDLSAGSQSRRTLQNYLDLKQIKL